MKAGLVSICGILDGSGSMSSVADEVVRGWNKFINDQREQAGECDVSLYAFSTEIKKVLFRRDLSRVQDLRRGEYYMGNSTALYDAIGTAVTQLDKSLSYDTDDNKPEKIIVYIQTDGEENASGRFSLLQLKRMIAEYEARGNWEFLFIGMGIDAKREGAKFGIRADNILEVSRNGEGNQTMYAAVGSYTSAIRSGDYTRKFGSVIGLNQ